MEAREIIGLDVGLNRSGIARASNIAKLAEPFRSVPTKDLTKELQKYISEHKVEAIAVGLPRNLKGEDTDQTVWIRSWLEQTKHKINLPFYWQDEALTSQQAISRKLSAKSSFDEHAVAAAIILQNFLDTPEAGRVAC